ncbi:MAG: hypothetical protein QM710_10530 [Flavobacterium sp.]
MVRIVNYQKRQTEEGKEFFTLELQGGIEMVKSQQTGQFYVTARKVSIPSTFDEQTCISLVGTQLPGEVHKVACDPYDYVVKETGETITLTHKYEYAEEKAINKEVEKSKSTIEEFMSNNPKSTSFSTNGQYAH